MKVFRSLTVIIAILAIGSCAEYLPKGVSGASEATVVELEIDTDVLAAEALSDEELAAISGGEVGVAKDFIAEERLGGKMMVELEPIAEEPAAEEVSKDLYLKALGIEGLKPVVRAKTPIAELNDSKNLQAGDEVEIAAQEDKTIVINVVEGACNVKITINTNDLMNSLGNTVADSETFKTAITKDATTRAALEPIEVLK